jgi:hypothetical protein
MKGTFEPDGPLWEHVNGMSSPTYTCAFCHRRFRADTLHGLSAGLAGHPRSCMGVRMRHLSGWGHDRSLNDS